MCPAGVARALADPAARQLDLRDPDRPRTGSFGRCRAAKPRANCTPAEQVMSPLGISSGFQSVIPRLVRRKTDSWVSSYRTVTANSGSSCSIRRPLGRGRIEQGVKSGTDEHGGRQPCTSYHSSAEHLRRDDGRRSPWSELGFVQGRLSTTCARSSTQRKRSGTARTPASSASH